MPRWTNKGAPLSDAAKTAFREEFGLGNVDNTSDADKPVSDATQQALDDLETSLQGELSDVEGVSLRLEPGESVAPLDQAARSGRVVGFDQNGDLDLQTPTEIVQDPTSEKGFDLIVSEGSSARREAVKLIDAVPAQAAPTRATHARVVFIADDGPSTDLTFLKPIFDNDATAITGMGLTPKTYDPCVGTLAIISSFVNVGSNLTTAQLQAFEADGWEIASHTKDHLDLSAQTYAACEAQCADSYNTLRGMGLEVNSLVYPFGGNNKQVREIVAKYYRSAVAVVTPQAYRNAAPVAQYSLNRYGIETDTDWSLGDINTVAGTTGTKFSTLQDRKNLVDRTVVEGGMLIFMIHSAQLQADLVRSQILIDLLEYIQGKSEFVDGTLQITTLDEALNTHGNILTTGDFLPYPLAGFTDDNTRSPHHVIDARGASHVFPRHDALSYETVAGRTNASAASAYTMGKITMIGFTSAEALAASLPGSVEGILETWRLFAGDFSTRQFWYPFGANRRWTRFWQPGSSTWSAWVLIDDPTILPSTTMAMDDQGATAILRLNFIQSSNIRSRIDGGFSNGYNMILWAGNPLSQVITIGNGNRAGVNVGWTSIATLPPAEGIVSHSDVVVNTATKGLVLRSPDGNYWRATIDNAGAVTWSNIGAPAPA